MLSVIFRWPARSPAVSDTLSASNPSVRKVHDAPVDRILAIAAIELGYIFRSIEGTVVSYRRWLIHVHSDAMLRANVVQHVFELSCAQPVRAAGRVLFFRQCA